MWGSFWTDGLDKIGLLRTPSTYQTSKLNVLYLEKSQYSHNRIKRYLNLIFKTHVLHILISVSRFPRLFWCVCMFYWPKETIWYCYQKENIGKPKNQEYTEWAYWSKLILENMEHNKDLEWIIFETKIDTKSWENSCKR